MGVGEPPQDLLIAEGKAGSAQDILDLLVGANLRYASAETRMTIGNVRLHLRLLRRCSMAVLDPGSPRYEGSALDYFERNENVWGRRAEQTALQESGKYFDAFQAALPNLCDLRCAAENLHIAQLRGYSMRIGGRNVADQARGLLMLSKVPAALVERYPRHRALLTPYHSLKAFHEAFPAGLTLSGEPAACASRGCVRPPCRYECMQIRC